MGLLILDAEKVPRYGGRDSRFRFLNHSEREMTPNDGEETNYTFRPTSSSAMNVQSQFPILLSYSRLDLKTVEPSAEPSGSPELGLATLHIHDNIALDVPLNPHNVSTSKSGDVYLPGTIASTTDTPIAGHDARSVTQCLNYDVDIGDPAKKEETGVDDYADRHLDLNPSPPNLVSGSPRSTTSGQCHTNVTRMEARHVDFLKLSYTYADVEDDSLQGSFILDTDSDRDGNWVPGRYQPGLPSGQEIQDSVTAVPILDSHAFPITRPASEQTPVGFPTADLRWITAFTTHAGYGGSASTTTDTSKCVGQSASSLSFSNNSLKHSFGKQGGPPPGGNDKPPDRQSSKSYDPQRLDSSVKLACPFRKHNPSKYGLWDTRYNICARTPLNINRLK